MEKKKVKSYLSEHKREIAIGAACVLIGLKIGKGRIKKNERNLIKTLRTVNGDINGTSFVDDLNELLLSSHSILPIKPNNKSGVDTMENLCDFLISEGDLNKSQVSGAVLFTRK